MERAESDFGIDRIGALNKMFKGDFSEASSVFTGLNVNPMRLLEILEMTPEDLTDAEKKVLKQQGVWGTAAMMASRDMGGPRS